MKKSASEPKNTIKDEEDYEANNAVDTLMRAHEIKNNKELMARVKKKAGRKLKALAGLKSDIKSIDDIRAAYKNKEFEQDSDDEMES